MSEPYFKRHVFFCQNLRDDGRRSCGECGSVELRTYAKNRLKEAGQHGKGKIRVNQAGCLDRCEEGPVIVVYPDNVWYTYVDEEDVDEIVDRHLIGGEPVERLRI